MSDQLDAMDYELLDERDPRGEASTNEQGDAINKSAKKAYVHPRFGGLTSKHESYGSGFEEEETVKSQSIDKTIPTKRRAVSAAENSENTVENQKRELEKATSIESILTATRMKGKANLLAPNLKPKVIQGRKKAQVPAYKKPQDEGRDDTVHGDDEEPKTPSPKKRRLAKDSTGKTNNDNAGSPSQSPSGMTVRNTPRRRALPTTTIASARGIPASWDQADDADRLLVTMKEDGKSWKEITTAYANITGKNVMPSTLPNRYNRIKFNMMCLKEGETRILLAAVHAVEAEFWGHVAQKMQNAGTQRFQREFLVKTWSELKSKAQAGNMSVDIYVEHVDGGALRSTPELGEHDAEEEKAGDEKVERQL